MEYNNNQNYQELYNAFIKYKLLYEQAIQVAKEAITAAQDANASFKKALAISDKYKAQLDILLSERDSNG